MEPRPLEKGDVVQLSPKVDNPHFAGCFMVVSDPKPWGAQGYVQAMGSQHVVTYKGRAYYRAKWEYMEYIGKAEWDVRDVEESQES